MAEALIEPPVAAALINFTRAEFAVRQIGTQSVSGRVEDGKHLRIAESGGAGDRALVLFTQQLTLEAFGSTLDGSSLLMREAAAVLRTVQHTTFEGVQFYELRNMGAGANSLDPVTKRARYSRTFSIDVRLLAL